MPLLERPTPQHLTSRELAAATGSTFSQIDRWCRRDLLPGGTPGSGQVRTFGPEEVAVARALRIVSRAALDVPAIPAMLEAVAAAARTGATSVEYLGLRLSWDASA